MTTREMLHRLVDELPDSELQAARRMLNYLRLTGDDRLLETLLEAPFDDEPETPEEAAAVAEAWEAVRRGEVVPLDEVRRELGL